MEQEDLLTTKKKCRYKPKCIVMKRNQKILNTFILLHKQNTMSKKKEQQNNKNKKKIFYTLQ